MNINSLWSNKKRRRRGSVGRCGSRMSTCSGPIAHNTECYQMEKRMEQFDQLLMAEHNKIQEHIDELTELRCELQSDCRCRKLFEKRMLKIEKRIMKLRSEMQDVRKHLMDSDCYLHKNEQRQRELQARLQELWNLITECCQLREMEVEGPNGSIVKVEAIPVAAKPTIIASPATAPGVVTETTTTITESK